MSDIIRLMSDAMKGYTISIRSRRQATFPKELLEKLDIRVGSKLTAKVENKKIILKPNKQIALDALYEIQKIIQKSGIKEEELQKEARFYRKKMAEDET